MVSADNLNLDVLEEIFSYLPHGPSLASVALVSRTFLEAVIPRLYANISFRIRQAKNYPEVSSRKVETCWVEFSVISETIRL